MQKQENAAAKGAATEGREFRQDADAEGSLFRKDIVPEGRQSRKDAVPENSLQFNKNSRKFRLFLISEHISRFRQPKCRIRWFRQQAYG